MIKIEIWSDFTCPFCYIGKRNLDRAISRFAYENHVEVEFKSYRLNPITSSEEELTVGDMLMKEYGMSPKEVRFLAEEVYELAEKADLSMSLSGIKFFDTSLAHRLVKYADKHGKGKKIISRLFRGYFTKEVNLEDKAALINLAVEIGLDKEDVDYTLSLNKYTKAMLSDENLAEEIGINSVPFYVFNEVHAVKGSQSTDVFLSILEELLDPDGEEPEKVVSKSGNQHTYCVGSKCEQEKVY